VLAFCYTLDKSPLGLFFKGAINGKRYTN
jgi:hypothetical protein